MQTVAAAPTLGLSIVVPVYRGAATVGALVDAMQATIERPDEAEAFAAEMIDRFGPLPEEVENLLQSIALKNLCRIAGIDKIDAAILSEMRRMRFQHQRQLERRITDRAVA